MFKGLCEFMGGRFIHHIDMLSEGWSSESGYIKFLMSRNLTKRIKEVSSNLMSWSSLWYFST